MTDRVLTEMLSAEEAAKRLGIRRASLYCYASRGEIRAYRSPADTRERLYPAADIAALMKRRVRQRRPKVAASTALDWGLPVLQSGITQLNNGRPQYRQHDVLALSKHATLEETACILWRKRYSGPFAALRALPPIPGGERMTPLDRAMAALAFAAGSATPFKDKSNESQLLQFVSAAAAGSRAAGAFIHQRLAKLWRADKATEDLIRQILVMSADHELSVSAFAVRVVASTGASLEKSLSAGLAALSGPLHTCGEIDGIVRLFRQAGENAGWQKRMTKAASERDVRGFGHPLYPDGDPRAKVVLDQLRLGAQERFLIELQSERGLQPMLSFALVALERAAKLPAGAAHVVFITGRSAGWIAHALEQKRSDIVIRPRAQYVAV